MSSAAADFFRKLGNDPGPNFWRRPLDLRRRQSQSTAMFGFEPRISHHPARRGKLRRRWSERLAMIRQFAAKHQINASNNILIVEFVEDHEVNARPFRSLFAGLVSVLADLQFAVD